MLRTRLFLNLLPFVVILLGTGAYAIVLFSRLSANIDATVAGQYQSVVAAQQMLMALSGMDREAWAATGGGAGRSDGFAEDQKRFEENLAVQLKNVSLAGEKELNRQLAGDYEAFRRSVVKLGTISEPKSRTQLYEHEITPSLLRMKVLLDKILKLNQRAILATGHRVRQTTSEVTRLMISALAIALVIFAYASFKLSRSVLKPLQQLTKATRELGQGNLNQTVPVLSQDELGELAEAFNRMVAQLREYRQSTSEEIVRLHRTMETTLASFPDPIFVLNRAGAIELKNPAAADLSSALHLSGQLPPRLREITQRTLERGEHFLPHSFDEVVSYRLNGSERFFLPRILAMRVRPQELFGVAVVLYDVTRFRLLDAAKTDLVATVSHELKTPLTSVRMALHLLLEKSVGALNPKQDELLEAARDDTERLLRILNNLLDLARLEEGNGDLQRESVAPASLLQTVREEMTNTIPAKQLRIECAPAPDLPAVLVDKQRIGHVFANLITNAVTHSPPGGRILLRAARAEEGWVQFSVSDEGPGIPAEYQSRIFDRFFRVPGQSKTGAGLGLSIAREITLAHGGRISVDSSPGQGATFYIVLRAANAL
jgi:NtrC-family two-component system sensor histidine kinase KinB